MIRVLAAVFVFLFWSQMGYAQMAGDIRNSGSPPSQRQGSKQTAKKEVPQTLTRSQIFPKTAPTPPANSALWRIISSQNLRVCVRSDTPPFGYFASRGLVGFDVDLAKNIAVQLSIYFRKNIVVSWSVIEARHRIPRIMQKSCDIVAAAFSYTKERAQKISFSSLYLTTNKVVLAAPEITRKLPIIAVVRGTTNYAANIPGQVRFFSNYKEIVYAITNNEVDYVVADRPIALNLINQVSKKFRLYKSLRQRERYGLGVHKDHKHLLSILNRALKDLARSGRLAYIYQKWM